MAAYVVCNTTLLELKKEKKQKTFFFVMHPFQRTGLTDGVTPYLDRFL